MLRAMGVAEELAQGAIRVSLGFATKRADIERFLRAFGELIKRLKQAAGWRREGRERGFGVETLMAAVQETVDRVYAIDIDKYKYGFMTDIECVRAPKGLNEDIVRFISAKKGEPEWLLEWRLEAYRRWQTMEEPNWANVDLPEDRLPGSLLLLRAEITEGPKSLDEVDPELLKTYEKLGIPLKEQEVLAGVRARR